MTMTREVGVQEAASKALENVHVIRAVTETLAAKFHDDENQYYRDIIVDVVSTITDIGRCLQGVVDGTRRFEINHYDATRVPHWLIVPIKEDTDET